MIPVIFNISKRLAFKKRNAKKFQQSDFLHKEIFLNHLDRLSMILQDMPSITLIDVPEYFLDLPEAKAFFQLKKTMHITNIQRDNEILPQHIQKQNAIIALLTCHCINDLVGYLIQINNALQSDGVFVGSFIGEKTLGILKKSFTNAELEITNACHNRFFPTIDIRDLGGLLQRAKFALPVADSENYRIHYQDLKTMINDIKATGESNYLENASKPLNRKTYQKALENLHNLVPNHIFDIDMITITGRKPSDAQQKPLKAGSAQISLTKILK